MIPTMPQRDAKLLIGLLVTIALTMLPVTAFSAAAGFALLLYFPGRLLLPILGLDRMWSPAGTTILALAVSWSVVPFFLNPVWHATNAGYTLLACLGLTLIALWAVIRPTDSPSPEQTFTRKVTVAAALLIAASIVPSIVFPYWPTELFGYPVPAEIHDYIKHQGLLFSLEQRPLPIGNPFFAKGAADPVYYYHFFYLIPATVRAWTHHTLTYETAFTAAAVLVALPLIGMVYLIAKRFTRDESSALLSTGLFSVIGAFDLFLYLPWMFHKGRPLIMLDFWVEHPYIIHNPLFQIVWSPQNVLAVLVVLVGVLLLSAGTLRRSWVLWGPVFAAAILGSSVWIALGALPALAIWAVTKRRNLPAIVGIGVLIAIVNLPTISNYLDSAAHPDRGLTFDWPVNQAAVFGRLVGPGIIANFLDLPFTLALEFGPKALLLPLVPIALWKRAWADDGLRWLMITAVLSILIASVVRVELIHNDLRHKIILLTMIFCAVIGGGVVKTVRDPTWRNPFGLTLANPRFGRLGSSMLVVIMMAGLLTELYESPATATRRYVEDHLAYRAASPERKQLIEAERAALGFMRHQLPPDAVVQGSGSPLRARLAQTVRKQIGVMEPWDDIAVFAPNDPTEYHRAVDTVLTELRQGSSAKDLHRILRSYGITHVFVGIVEREQWTALQRFDDKRYFNDLFNRDGVRVATVTQP